MDNTYALITGATSGIGLEFAQQLAKEKKNLILIARNLGRLESIKKTLMKSHPIDVKILSINLTKSDSATTLITFIEKENLEINFLIINAGYFILESHSESNQQIINDYIQIYITGPMQILDYCLAKMKPKREKAIIFVSSLAAFFPNPYFPMYAACKSFQAQWVKFNYQQMKQKGVQIQALCPGETKTEMVARAGFKEPKSMMSPEAVVKSSLRLLGKRAIVIPGFINKLYRLLVQITPLRFSTSVMKKVLENIYGLVQKTD